MRTLIDDYLESQRRLDTPVTRFADAHESGSSLAALSSQLIPLTAPGPGEQYAFQVDLDSCTGCKACVAGCHSLNGLDDHETWRDVGLLLSDSCSQPLALSSQLQTAAPFQQTVTTACHHCEDPGCLNGCPVLAYEKDPITGIVVHLDDQCIGCSYCVLKCPYDVPKYNERLGIVRKCDMCHGRLSAGEAPACVQSCPTQAITIIKVSVDVPTGPWLPAAPDASYTKPTTRYVSKKGLPTNLRAADADTLRPQHAHYALVFLLVLTQLALGLFVAASLNGGRTAVPALSSGSELSALSSQLGMTALALYAAGLLASVAHLGQPLRAWRVFLNLRRSWLSREAVLLGAAFPLLALPVLHFAGASLLANFNLTLPALVASALPLMSHAGIVLATLGVACSAMIYTDTRRRFWRAPQTLGRMFGTVAVAALAILHVPLSALVLVAKLALELNTYRGTSPSARLQQGPLHRLWGARLVLGLLAVLLFSANHSIFGFLVFALGELLERTLFFRAVDAPKMPGVPTS